MEAKERRGAQRRHLIQYLGALNGDTGEIIGRVVDISRDGVMLVSRIGILPQVPDSESSVGEGVGNRTNAAPGRPETCGRVRTDLEPHAGLSHIPPQHSFTEPLFCGTIVEVPNEAV